MAATQEGTSQVILGAPHIGALGAICDGSRGWHQGMGLTLYYPWRTRQVHQYYIATTGAPCSCASGSLEWAPSW
jgi:hypothetical protein